MNNIDFDIFYEAFMEIDVYTSATKPIRNVEKTSIHRIRKNIAPKCPIHKRLFMLRVIYFQLNLTTIRLLLGIAAR